MAEKKDTQSKIDNLLKLINEKKKNKEEYDSFYITVQDLRDIAIHLKKKSGETFSIDYGKASLQELVDEILRYDEMVVKNTSGSHCLPEEIIKEIERKKNTLIGLGRWFTKPAEAEPSTIVQSSVTREKTEAMKKFGKKEFEKERSVDPYPTRTPTWIFLGGQDCFAKEMADGSILIGLLSGNSGIRVSAMCGTETVEGFKELPAARDTCSVQLTFGKISKMLNFSVSLENTLVPKSRFILHLREKDINIKETFPDTLKINEIAEMMNMPTSMFSGSSYVYIEKVDITLGKRISDFKLNYVPVDKIDVSVTPFRKPALMDAGRSFMFELLFGFSEDNKSFFKRSTRRITGVFTNPSDVRIGKIYETAKRQAKNRVKEIIEKQIESTQTILDDSRFLEGMNEVRWKIATNSTLISDILASSDLSPDQKSVILENLEILKNNDFTIADIIEITFSNKSPFKHKAMSCALKGEDIEAIKKSMKKGGGKKVERKKEEEPAEEATHS